MNHKFVLLPSLFVALLVLLVSVYRTASVRYVFSQSTPSEVADYQVSIVDYDLPAPSASPHYLLWPITATARKMAVFPANDELAKARINLQLSDERLVLGQALVQQGRHSRGVAILARAEKYLEDSYNIASKHEDSKNKHDYYLVLSRASLKHREVLETVLAHVPEDARPEIVKIMDIPVMVFRETSSLLAQNGMSAPESPF